MGNIAGAIAPQTIAGHDQNHGVNLTLAHQICSRQMSATLVCPGPVRAIHTMKQRDDGQMMQMTEFRRYVN